MRHNQNKLYNNTPDIVPEIPEDISHLTKSEKAQLVATIFETLFFATSEYTYTQKILIFREFVLKDYISTRRKANLRKNRVILTQLVDEL